MRSTIPAISRNCLTLFVFAALWHVVRAQQGNGSGGPAGNLQPELMLPGALSGLISFLEISPDSRWFATASFGSSTIGIHDFQSATVLRTILTGPSAFEAIAITPDSKAIVSATGSGRLRLWDVASGRLIGECMGPSNVRAIAISPNGRFLAALGSLAVQLIRFDGLALVHSVELPEGRNVTTLLQPHLLSFTADNNTLLLAHSDGSVRAVAVASGEMRSCFKSEDSVEEMIASPDGRTVVFVQGTAELLWHQDQPHKFIKLDDDKFLRLFGFTTDGTQFLSHSGYAFVMRETASGSAFSHVETDVLGYAVASWSSMSKVVIGSSFKVMDAMKSLATNFGNLNLHLSRFDLNTGREFEFAELPMRFDTWPMVTSDRRLLFMSQSDGTDIWDLFSGRIVRHLNPPAALTGAMISPSGEVLVETFANGTARVFNTRLWKEVITVRVEEQVTGRDELKGGAAAVATSIASFDRGRPWLSDLSTVSGTFAIASGKNAFIFDLANGNLLRTLVHEHVLNHLCLSLDGTMLATVSADRNLVLWNVSSGHELWNRTFASEGKVLRLLRATTSDRLWIAESTGTVREITIATGDEVRKVLDTKDTTRLVAVSPDRRLLATSNSINQIGVWNSLTGKLEQTVRIITPLSGLEWVSATQLIGSQFGGSARLWSLSSQRDRATLIWSGAGEDWLVASDDGYFDGSPGEWSRLKWRFENNIFDSIPVEAFFNEFYRPGLLSQLLTGGLPAPVRSLAERDRRLPFVTLSVGQTQGARLARVSLHVAEAPPDQRHSTGSGVRDVRLFRNGTLVRLWHGDVLPKGLGAATLDADTPVTAGENHFTAYAFNHDDVKSLDASLQITGTESLRRQGTFYCIGIGINRYDHPDLTLRYAVADAASAVNVLAAEQQKLHAFGRVETVTLLDEEATKFNIMALFRKMSGDVTKLPRDVPKWIRSLPIAQPEDTIVIYFAGHGIAHESGFYLVPRDVGLPGDSYLGARTLPMLLAHSISDQELSQAVEKLNVANLVLVIDACNSGRVLGGEEERLGPMNSRGLAQLAYEKGMYVLAAAQGTQAATEVTELGHGLLTYSLINEGLAKREAAHNGIVDAQSWFDYAANRVPALQRLHVEEALSGGRQVLLPESEGPRRESFPGIQHPRAFYRREAPSTPLVLARDPDWYTVAARSGDPLAMRLLADRYDSIGGTRDPAEADRWRLKAAEAGDVASSLEFASRYGEGRGVSVDKIKCLMFLARAVTAGSPIAARLLGDILSQSSGYDAASILYRKAAMGGDEASMNMLGWMYATGSGVGRDDRRAFNWFLKAANRGETDAMNSLALCYSKGIGVDRDSHEAASWFRKLASHGDPIVRDALRLYLRQSGAPSRNLATSNENVEFAPPPRLANPIQIAWFSGLSTFGAQRIWRWEGGDGQWWFDNGLPFMKDGVSLLDGPWRNSAEIDISSFKWAERLKPGVKLLFNQSGRVFFISASSVGNDHVSPSPGWHLGDHVLTSNSWQLDFLHSVYLPETNELKVSCLADQPCVFPFSVGKSGLMVQEPSHFVTILVENKAMAEDASRDLQGIAAQFGPAKPRIESGVRWQNWIFISRP